MPQLSLMGPSALIRAAGQELPATQRASAMTQQSPWGRFQARRGKQGQGVRPSKSEVGQHPHITDVETDTQPRAPASSRL